MECFELREVIERIFQRTFKDIGGFVTSGIWIRLPKSNVRYIGMYISEFIPILSRYLAQIKQIKQLDDNESTGDSSHVTKSKTQDDTGNAIKEIFNLQRVISQIIILLNRLNTYSQEKVNANESAST